MMPELLDRMSSTYVKSTLRFYSDKTRARPARKTENYGKITQVAVGLGGQTFKFPQSWL